MESYRLVLVGALPYIALLALQPWPRLYWTALSLFALALLVSAAWPLSMGLWVAEYWQHGRCQTPPEHTADYPGINHGNLVTLYYPGLGASWMQARRYDGHGHLDDKDGTEAHIANAPRLLYNIHPINPPEAMFSENASIGAMALFAYTLPATFAGRLMQRIQHGKDYLLAWPLTSFAQQPDLDCFLRPLRRALDDRSARRLVVAGSSRGASTVLGAVTQLTPDERKRIAFVLAEGAFDSVPSVAAARYWPWLANLGVAILPWLTRYDPMQPSPLALAAQFPADVSVLFVTSKVDTHVPMANTLAVRDAVLKARDGDATHVHTLVLEHSHHSYYVNDHIADQTAYRAAMARMYQLYC